MIGLDDERGIAMIAVMTASTVLLALGLSLAATISVEVGIAARQREGVQTLHAADAALERAIADLAVVADWDAALAGLVVSPHGAGAGEVKLPDGATLDVAEETWRLRCGQPGACGDAAMDQPTAARPWGRNNPRWTVYAAGSLARWLPEAEPAARAHVRAYVVVWVADDPSENDGQPLRDGGPPALADPANAVNPGRGAIWLRSQAYGPAGARRTVEAVVERDPRFAPGRVRVRVWREIT